MNRKKPTSPPAAPPATGPAGSETVIRSRAHHRGSRPLGVRLYNERVVLHALRLHGSLAATELARQTRLTTQTISLITKDLSDEGLLLRGEPRRGRVGQPAVPLRLNPDGVYSIGVVIGRRRMDMLLLDFVGQVRERWSLEYDFPQPAPLLDVIGKRLHLIRRQLGRDRAERLQGVGVACPLSLDSWHDLLGIDEAMARRWSGVDFRAAVSRLTTLPVMLLKDTAAACLAELVTGHGRDIGSFLYLFVDTFIGGGLVIDGRLRGGRHGNAGAIGSMAMSASRATQGRAPAQMLSEASLFALEDRYARAGLDRTATADARALQAPWRNHTDDWLAQASDGIAMAAQGAACLLDIEAVVVDGTFSRDLLAELVAETDLGLGRYDWQGTARPQLMAGSAGADARALGAALLPIYANFAPDRDLFLNLAA